MTGNYSEFWWFKPLRWASQSVWPLTSCSQRHREFWMVLLRGTGRPQSKEEPSFSERSLISSFFPPGWNKTSTSTLLVLHVPKKKLLFGCSSDPEHQRNLLLVTWWRQSPLKLITVCGPTRFNQAGGISQDHLCLCSSWGRGMTSPVLEWPQRKGWPSEPWAWTLFCCLHKR